MRLSRRLKKLMCGACMYRIYSYCATCLYDQCMRIGCIWSFKYDYFNLFWLYQKNTGTWDAAAIMANRRSCHHYYRISAISKFCMGPWAMILFQPHIAYNFEWPILMYDVWLTEYWMSEFLMSDHWMSEFLMSDYWMSEFWMSDYPILSIILSQNIINIAIFRPYADFKRTLQH